MRHEDGDARPVESRVDAILNDAELPRDEKIARLRQMAYDQRELAVAMDEGMGDTARDPAAALERIQEALHSLGADDDHSGAKQ